MINSISNQSIYASSGEKMHINRITSQILDKNINEENTLRVNKIREIVTKYKIYTFYNESKLEKK